MSKNFWSHTQTGEVYAVAVSGNAGDFEHESVSPQIVSNHFARRGGERRTFNAHTYACYYLMRGRRN